MSNNVFLISDTHFGHENACTKFKKCDGSPLRDFPNAAACDEAMVERWNAVVKPHDKVYHLGDVVINVKFLQILARLNGKKKLIRGNHDIFPTEKYLQHFTDIYGVRVLEDMILSHIPLHPESITQRFGTNIHGHLHDNRVMREVREAGAPDPILGVSKVVVKREIDPRYFSVCVEQIDFTPIEISDLRGRIKKQREDLGYVPPADPWGNGPG